MKHVRGLWSGDEGISMVELLIASIITAVVSAIMISWVLGVSAADRFQDADFEALDNIRVAKARLVKELRFADAVLGASDDKTLIFWIDDQDTGTIGYGDPGEYVTWAIRPGGTLVRFVNLTPVEIVPQADRLVEPKSRFTYTAETVTIEFVADVDTGEGPDVRSFRTEVNVRNS